MSLFYLQRSHLSLFRTANKIQTIRRLLNGSKVVLVLVVLVDCIECFLYP